MIKSFRDISVSISRIRTQEKIPKCRGQGPSDSLDIISYDKGQWQCGTKVMAGVLFKQPTPTDEIGLSG